MAYTQLPSWKKLCLRLLFGGVLAVPILAFNAPDPFGLHLDWVHAGVLVILVGLSMGLVLNYRGQPVRAVYLMVQLEVLALWLGFAFVHHFGIVLFEPGHYAVSTRVSMTAAAASVMGVALAIALVDCVILALANGIRRLTRPSTGPAEPTVS